MAFPRLTDLCVQVVVDNLDYIADVGDTDSELLERILIHCSAEQLQRIEDATTDRDLSSITDDLWRRCYGRKYGADNMATVAARMKRRGVSVLWRDLYEAKAKEQEETQRRCVNRLRELYLEAEQQKQSRQVQLVDMPLKSRKRTFSSASGSSRTSSISGGRLFKRARIEYAKSHDKMVQASIRKHHHPRPPSRTPLSAAVSLRQRAPLASPPAARGNQTRQPTSALFTRAPTEKSPIGSSAKEARAHLSSTKLKTGSREPARAPSNPVPALKRNVQTGYSPPLAARAVPSSSPTKGVSGGKVASDGKKVKGGSAALQTGGADCREGRGGSQKPSFGNSPPVKRQGDGRSNPRSSSSGNSEHRDGRRESKAQRQPHKEESRARGNMASATRGTGSSESREN